MLTRFKERIYPVRGSYWFAMTLAGLLPVEMLVIRFTDIVAGPVGDTGLDGFMKNLIWFMEYDYGVVLAVWWILWVGVTFLALVRGEGCRRCLDFVSLVLLIYHSLVIFWLACNIGGER
jgi:hypothetical protein